MLQGLTIKTVQTVCWLRATGAGHAQVSVGAVSAPGSDCLDGSDRLPSEGDRCGACSGECGSRECSRCGGTCTRTPWW